MNEQELNQNPNHPDRSRIVPEEVAARQQAQTIPIVEEFATVGSKTVETGRVLISKKVDEHQESVHVVGTHDETEVERITLNRMIDVAPAVRYEGHKMIIPIIKEVAVVEKRLMLVEEVRVTKRKVQTQETVPVTLRKERLEVTREPNPGTTQAAGKDF